MKIIYAFIIALILSVLAFFLAIRITDSTGAALFLLGMLPVTFIVIIIYTKLLETFHVKAFKYVVLYTFLACYIMVFMTIFLLGSDSRWGIGHALRDAFRVMTDVYLLICNMAITLIYSVLFLLFSRLSRKKG
nr:hypothetical protein [uncultured Capnocytophaga sp.]